MTKINLPATKPVIAQKIERRKAIKWALAGLPICTAMDLFAQPSNLSAANDNAPPGHGPQPGESSLLPNPHGWPADERDQRALHAFFGDPLDNSHIVKVRCPWPLVLAWDQARVRKHLYAHSKVAAALGEVLEAVLDHYGPTDIERLGLNQFGGDHVDRRMRGATKRWSTHAWGIAFDFDPSNNQYNWRRDRARFARPEYDAWWALWEKHGFYSLGRHKNYDWMHVQAAWRP